MAAGTAFDLYYIHVHVEHRGVDYRPADAHDVHTATPQGSHVLKRHTARIGDLHLAVTVLSLPLAQDGLDLARDEGGVLYMARVHEHDVSA